MLQEQFIASISSQTRPTTSSTQKDVGIFVQELHPHSAQRHAFKKSATLQKCLAVSETHIFAAQKDKAVVHVYNREKGSQEATVPFPERISALCLACDGAVLVLGTDGGRILLWEVRITRCYLFTLYLL